MSKGRLTPREEVALPSDPLLTPRAVAKAFGVDPKTVTRWAANGWIAYVSLPSGHRRYRMSEVKRFLDAETMPSGRPAGGGLSTDDVL